MIDPEVIEVEATEVPVEADLEEQEADVVEEAVEDLEMKVKAVKEEDTEKGMNLRVKKKRNTLKKRKTTVRDLIRRKTSRWMIVTIPLFEGQLSEINLFSI